MSCVEVIGEGWARFISCVRNGDANNLNETGRAMALGMEDTAIGAARMAGVIEEFPLNDLVQSLFDSVAVHQNGVAIEAQELDRGIVLRR